MDIKNTREIKDQLIVGYLKKIKKRAPCPACNGGMMDYDKKADSWICSSCGYKFLDTENIVDRGLWYCNRCGVLLNNQEVFDGSLSQNICENCGCENVTSAETSKNICLDCGKILPNQEAIWCDDCKKIRRRKAIKGVAIGAGAIFLLFKLYSELTKDTDDGVPQINDSNPDLSNDSFLADIETDETMEDENANDLLLLLDDVVENEELSQTGEGRGGNDIASEAKVIYTTNGYAGYGKHNYYYNRYKLEGDKVVKYKCHEYKFFDGHENNWEREEDVVDSWNIDDENMPEWLRQYLD